MFKVACKENGNLECQSKLILDEATYKKLECGALQEKINRVCEDLDIDGRFIEESDNQKLSVITINTDEFDDESNVELEKRHICFLSAVANMEIPKPEEEKKEDRHKEPSTLELVNSVLEHIDTIKKDGLSFSGAILYLTVHPLFPLEPFASFNAESTIEILKCYSESCKI